jgi:hypothetical protein
MHQFASKPEDPNLGAEANAFESVLTHSILNHTKDNANPKGTVTITALRPDGRRAAFGIGTRVRVVTQQFGTFTVLLTATHVLTQIERTQSVKTSIEHNGKMFPSKDSPLSAPFLENWRVLTTSKKHDITMLIAPGPDNGVKVWSSLECAELQMGPVIINAPVTLVGSNAGGNYISEGTIKTTNSGVIHHTCSSTPTSSGGPLLHKGRVVAVHVANGDGVTGTPGNYNIANSLAIFKHMARYMYGALETPHADYSEVYDEDMEYDSDDVREAEWQGRIQGKSRHGGKYYDSDFSDGEDLTWAEWQEKDELRLGDFADGDYNPETCSHGVPINDETIQCEKCEATRLKLENARMEKTLKKALQRYEILEAKSAQYDKYEADQAIIKDKLAQGVDMAEIPDDVKMSEKKRATALRSQASEEMKLLDEALAEKTDPQMAAQELKQTVIDMALQLQSQREAMEQLRQTVLQHGAKAPKKDRMKNLVVPMDMAAEVEMLINRLKERTAAHTDGTASPGPSAPEAVSVQKPAPKQQTIKFAAQESIQDEDFRTTRQAPGEKLATVMEMYTTYKTLCEERPVSKTAAKKAWKEFYAMDLTMGPLSGQVCSRPEWMSLSDSKTTSNGDE